MARSGHHQAFHPPARSYEVTDPKPVPGMGTPKLINFAIEKEGRQFDAVDLVVLQCQFTEEQEWVVDTAKEHGCAVVIDYDDWHYAVHEQSRVARFYTPETLAQGRRIAAKADLVTVTTPKLAELYRELAGNVKILANRTENGLWRRPPERSWERPRLGWVGNHHWHADAVDLIKENVVPWLKKNSEVQFLAAGDLELHELVGTPERQRLHTPPVGVHELASLMTFDVGIVPLELSLFNECKSYLKGLEYASAGIPFVASPTGEYTRLREMWGPIVRLAESPKEWADSLDALFHTSIRDAREQSGRLRMLAGNESYTLHWPEWSLTYQGVINAPERHGMGATEGDRVGHGIHEGAGGRLPQHQRQRPPLLRERLHGPRHGRRPRR